MHGRTNRESIPIVVGDMKSCVHQHQSKWIACVMWLCRKQRSLLGGRCRWLRYNGRQRWASAVHRGTSQTRSSCHSLQQQRQLHQRRAERQHLSQVRRPRASHALGLLSTQQTTCSGSGVDALRPQLHHLLRSVVDLLHNMLYDKSTTNLSKVYRKSTAFQHVKMLYSLLYDLLSN